VRISLCAAFVFFAQACARRGGATFYDACVACVDGAGARFGDEAIVRCAD
jgi:hypothetical protein